MYFHLDEFSTLHSTSFSGFLYSSIDQLDIHFYSSILEKIFFQYFMDEIASDALDTLIVPSMS